MSARSPDVLRRARDTARRWRQRSPAGAAREAIGCDRRADPPPRRLPPTPPGAQAEHAVLPGRALGYAAATSDERDIRKRLAASASAIGAWCHASVSWELVTVVHDTLRAQARGGGNRPALEYALAQIATGDAHVIVLARLRELTDSVAELGTLLRRLHDAGGYLVALDYGLDTSTEAGRLAARALIEVGDWERARILEQSRPGLAAARAKRQLDQHASEHDAAARRLPRGDPVTPRNGTYGPLTAPPFWSSSRPRSRRRVGLRSRRGGDRSGIDGRHSLDVAADPA